MTTRFLSAVFIAAFLLLMSLTAGKTDAKTSFCPNKPCSCIHGDSELQHTP